MGGFRGGVASAVEGVPGGEAEIDPLDAIGEKLGEKSWDGSTEDGFVA